MNSLLTDAAARSIRYLETLDARSVAPTADAVAALRAFDEALPQTSSDSAAVLRMLDEVGSPATTAMAGRRFFGFVIGGSLPVTLAANWLAGAWDQNAGLGKPTPSASYLEQVSLRWLLELLRLPRECAGSFVTGATVANLCGLAAARHAVLKRAGWNVEADGLFGAPPITVVIGAEAHPSVTKSLGVLGLGRTRVVKVPVDAQGRMRVELMPAIAGPTIVCAQLGNVNTGACDDVAAICRRAKSAGAWVHVDGAFEHRVPRSGEPAEIRHRRARDKRSRALAGQSQQLQQPPQRNLFKIRRTRRRLTKAGILIPRAREPVHRKGHRQ